MSAAAAGFVTVLVGFASSAVIVFQAAAPFSPTSTPLKRIRVVSTFEFELR
ncbi:MAG: hypothetical protein ACREJY_11755 [Candidatus Rokuibacteriota bacterium]